MVQVKDGVWAIFLKEHSHFLLPILPLADMTNVALCSFSSSLTHSLPHSSPGRHYQSVGLYTKNLCTLSQDS